MVTVRGTARCLPFVLVLGGTGAPGGQASAQSPQSVPGNVVRHTSGPQNPTDAVTLTRELRRLAAETTGTLGVHLVHVESNTGTGINDDDWFPMMSVYKLPIAIHALRQAQSGLIDLDRHVELGPADRRPGFSPLARVIEKSGPQTSTLRGLLSAIVRTSDNTASDRLLRETGGPAAVTATLRDLHIVDVNVNRYEWEFAADYYGVARSAAMSLEQFAAAVERVPHDQRRRAATAYLTDRRDAARPRAFAHLLRRLVQGALLNRESTQWLLTEMSEMHARDGRLRAGLPEGTFAALRPGTSGETAGVRAAHHDTAVVRLPDGTHLVIATFLKGSRGTETSRDAVLASVARAAYGWAVAPVPNVPD